MAHPSVFRIYKGRILSIREIAEECGLHKMTITRHAWKAQDITALVEASLKKQERAKETRAACDRAGMGSSTYGQRRRRGWTPEEAELIPVGMR